MNILKPYFHLVYGQKVLTALFMSPGVDHNAWELANEIKENYKRCLERVKPS